MTSSTPHNVWDTLSTVLDTCPEPVSFWWRDDDITSDTPALRTLKHLSRQTSIPLALAVIPAYVTDTLGLTLRTWSQATVLQHGYDHNNYALPYDKKSEFPCYRPPSDLLSVLVKGQKRLQSVFDNSMIVQVFVPPWNRFCWRLVPLLQQQGYKGLSCFHSTKIDHKPNTIPLINTHIDIIDWKTRTFIGETNTLTQIISHVQKYKNSTLKEPIGLLTHHWIHTEKIWSFLQNFLTYTSHHTQVRWLSATSLFCTTP